MKRLLTPLAAFACALAVPSAWSAPALQPVVEAEEDIYSYTNANNGAGPLWCHGSTCLVRIGDDVFARRRIALAKRVLARV